MTARAAACEQVERDVAVADGVERVARGLGEAELARGRGPVERQRRAGAAPPNPSGQKRAASRGDAREALRGADEASARAPSSQNASDTGCAGCQCVVAASSVPRLQRVAARSVDGRRGDRRRDALAPAAARSRA